jgi:hypothetical protein
MDALYRPTFKIDEGAPPETADLFSQLVALTLEQPAETLAVLDRSGQTHEEVIAHAADPAYAGPDDTHQAQVLRTLASIFRGECDAEIEYDDRTEADLRFHRDRLPQPRVRAHRVRFFVGRLAAWAGNQNQSDGESQAA